MFWSDLGEVPECRHDRGKRYPLIHHYWLSP